MSVPLSSVEDFQKPTYLQDKDLPMENEVLHVAKACNFFVKQLSQGPLEEIAVFKQLKVEHPEAWGCIRKKFTKLEQPTEEKGLLQLGDSQTRKLMILARVYFSAQDGLLNAKLREAGDKAAMKVVAQNQDEAYEFLARIPGVQLVQRAKPGYLERCHHLAFFGEPWFDSKRAYPLFESPSSIKKFLVDKGYVSSLKPEVGDVIVYFYNNRAEHYGKVCGVGKTLRETMIISKFGEYHIYIHRMELTQFYYGKGVLFFRKKTLSDGKED